MGSSDRRLAHAFFLKIGCWVTCGAPPLLTAVAASQKLMTLNARGIYQEMAKALIHNKAPVWVRGREAETDYY